MVFLCREGKMASRFHLIKGAKVSALFDDLNRRRFQVWDQVSSQTTTGTFWHRHLSPRPVIKRASQFTLIPRVNFGFRPFLFLLEKRPRLSALLVRSRAASNLGNECNASRRQVARHRSGR